MPRGEHITFESTTPSFLRRLRGEAPSDTGSGLSSSQHAHDPDRHAVPQVRAKRPRNPEDDDEDRPVYVDALTGEVVDGKVLGVEGGGNADAGADAGGGGGVSVSNIDDDGGDDGNGAARMVTQRVAEIGGGLVGRRKLGGAGGPRVVRAVNDDDDDDGELGKGEEIAVAKNKTTKRSGVKEADQILGRTSTTKERTSSKVKKKGKKIKLSFDE